MNFFSKCMAGGFNLLRRSGVMFHTEPICFADEA